MNQDAIMTRLVEHQRVARNDYWPLRFTHLRGLQWLLGLLVLLLVLDPAFQTLVEQLVNAPKSVPVKRLGCCLSRRAIS